MKRTKRREVVIEREQILLLRGAAPLPERPHCPICGPGSVLLTPEEAHWLCGETVRTICRRAERGEVHSLDAPDGRLLVCLTSLAQGDASGSAELAPGSDAESVPRTRKKQESA